MNKICLMILLAAFWCGTAWAQLEPRVVRLTGIISLPDFKRALVVADANSKDPARMILQEGDRAHDVEMLQIDGKTGRAKVTVDLDPQVLSLHTNQVGTNSTGTKGMAKIPVVAVPEIQLQDADLGLLVRLYGELTQRTVLHPTLPMSLFTLNADAANRAQAAFVLAKALEGRGLSVIPDGEKFVMIVPTARVAMASPHSPRVTVPQPRRDLISDLIFLPKAARKEPLIPAGEINFPQVDLEIAVEVYGELTGRKLDQRGPFPKKGGSISLVTESALTRDEIIYALDTLFGWEGIRMMPEGEDMIRAVAISAK